MQKNALIKFKDLSNTIIYQIDKELAILFKSNSFRIMLWLRTFNTHLNCKPRDMVKTDEGAITLLNYLRKVNETTNT